MGERGIVEFVLVVEAVFLLSLRESIVLASEIDPSPVKIRKTVVH